MLRLLFSTSILVFILVVCVTCSYKSKIYGHWSCQEKVRHENGFILKYSSFIDIKEDSTFNDITSYQYNFDDGSNLSARLRIKGNWLMDKKSYKETVKDVSFLHFKSNVKNISLDKQKQLLLNINPNNENFEYLYKFKGGIELSLIDVNT